MGEYEPKIEVQFPEVVPVAKSSIVKLECFALGKYVHFILFFYHPKTSNPSLFVHCFNNY